MIVTENSPRRPLRSVSSILVPALALSVVLAALAAAAVPLREQLYLTIAQTVEASALGPLAGVVAGQGLLVLVALTAVLAVHLWRSDDRGFRTLVVAGAGVVSAYLASETIKLLVTEPRPCRTFGVSTVLECPEVGDWSWPSNHSVIAASFATACVLARPRLLWVVAPLGVVLAFSRVAVGVHYVHDVLAGMALGVLVVSLVVAVARPYALRMPIPTRGREVR